LTRGSAENGHLFGGVMKEHEGERVAGYCVRMRCESAMATRFGRREAVFAVEDHGVRAVEA